MTTSYIISLFILYLLSFYLEDSYELKPVVPLSSFSIRLLKLYQLSSASLMFLYTSFYNFNFVVSVSICLQIYHLFLFIQIVYTLQIIFPFSYLSGLLSMVKAFITGFFICHTTNILRY